MRLLLVHADRAGYEATREADPEAEPDPPKTASAEDCLAAFVGVEAGDGAAPAVVGRAGAAAVRDVADRLRVDCVVVVPCSHLVDDPAAVPVTATALDALAADITDLAVTRAPAGWDLAVDLDGRGHPHAVTARRVRPDGDDESPAFEWYVVVPGGDRRPLAEGSVENPALAAVLDAVRGDRSPKRGHPGARLLSATGLGGEDRLSPDGEFRRLPRGTLVRDAVLERVDDLLADYGAVPVETPSTIDVDERWVRESLRTTPRGTASGGSTALRPSTRLGHLSVLRERSPGRSDCPIRLSEVGTSFRPSDGKRGPTTRTGITAPELTVVCATPESSRTEFERALDLARTATADLGLDPEAVLTVSRACFETQSGWIDRLVNAFDRRILLAVREGSRPVARMELFAVADDRVVGLSTVDLDADVAELAGVDIGTEAGPWVVHSRPIGTVDRALRALVAAGARNERSRLPVWLSPTQVRLIPVSGDHHERCDRLATAFEREGVRADVDDRGTTVGDRIARAQDDWVPYYAVVGDGDTAESLSITVRATGREVSSSVPDAVDRVRSAVGDRPTVSLRLPSRLSDRTLVRTENVE